MPAHPHPQQPISLRLRPLRQYSASSILGLHRPSQRRAISRSRFAFPASFGPGGVAATTTSADGGISTPTCSCIRKLTFRHRRQRCTHRLGSFFTASQPQAPDGHRQLPSPVLQPVVKVDLSSRPTGGDCSLEPEGSGAPHKPSGLYGVISPR